MKPYFRFLPLFAAIILLISSNSIEGANYIQAPPMTQVISGAAIGEVKNPGAPRLPIITWGGDIATILGNGNSPAPKGGSIFSQNNVQTTLFREDSFPEQVKAYMRGDTPYLRGTLGMINRAVEVLSADLRTKPVIIYQLTWSTGGDCLVVRDTVKTLADLKGKTVVLQAFGPHEDFLIAALKTAGLTLSDVTVKYTKDLTGTDETAAEAFRSDASIAAAFVITPDGLALTSNGTVGTGAEGSVKNARILYSTKTANRVIADIYAVRSDYLESNRNQVEAFVHSLMLADQELRRVMSNREAQSQEYNAVVTAAAEILLDSPSATADAAALYGDCSYVGFAGNVQFFGDPNQPRNFDRMTKEIQSAFITAGYLSKQYPLGHAQWDYNRLKEGLANVDAVEAPRFNQEKVAEVIGKKQQLGTLSEGELYSFEIFFQPNQNTFPEELYRDSFDKVIEYAATYGGAVITIEGHTDPLGYLKEKKNNAAELILNRIRQSSKNLSLTRANAVRDAVVAYAQKKGVTLDSNQFTAIGHGFNQPKTGLDSSNEPLPPKTKEEWLSNMRVVFRMIQVEAEAQVFEALDFAGN